MTSIKKLLVSILSMTLVLSTMAPVFAEDEVGTDENQNAVVTQDDNDAAVDEESEEMADEAEEEQALVESDEASEETVSEPEEVEPVDIDSINIKSDRKYPKYKPNEAVVLMKDSLSSKAVNAELQSIDSNISIDSTEKVYGQNQTIAVVKSDLSTEKLVKKLNSDKNVIIAEPNYVYHTMGVTSDTYADKQWGYEAGSIDFAKESNSPHIRSAVIEGDNLVISGFGFKNVKVTVNGEDVDVINSSNSSLEIANNNWTNKIITITATNESGTSTKDIYLVKGKKSFHKIDQKSNDDDADYFGSLLDSEFYTTGGKTVYKCDEDTIYKIAASDIVNSSSEDEIDWNQLATIDDSYFSKIKKNKNAEYGVVISDSIAYMNGRIYLIAGYGEIARAEVVIGQVDIGGGWVMEETEERAALYSGEYKLLSIGTRSGSVRVEKTLPSSVNQSEGSTIAAYNGKLYVLGGYDYSDGSGSLTKSVSIYNPVTKKWTKGPELPSEGAEGQAVQSGNKLVYMSKVSNNTKPELIILSNGKWTSESIDALCKPGVMKTELGEYHRFNFLLGHCKSDGKEAVVVTGIPTENGDTFTYNLVSKTFKDTGYQYSDKLAYSNVYGVAVGSNLIVSAGGMSDVSYAKISSALLKMTTSKKGKGSITKTKYFVPGNKATVTAKAKKGYYVASATVNGKTKKFTKKLRSRKIVVSNAITKNAKVKVVFKKSPKSSKAKKK